MSDTSQATAQKKNGGKIFSCCSNCAHWNPVIKFDQFAYKFNWPNHSLNIDLNLLFIHCKWLWLSQYWNRQLKSIFIIWK
jgi:hypothetical protein